MLPLGKEDGHVGTMKLLNGLLRHGGMGGWNHTVQRGITASITRGACPPQAGSDSGKTFPQPLAAQTAFFIRMLTSYHHPAIAVSIKCAENTAGTFGPLASTLGTDRSRNSNRSATKTTCQVSRAIIFRPQMSQPMTDKLCSGSHKDEPKRIPSIG